MKKIILAFLAIAIAGLIYSSLSGESESPEAYRAAIQKERNKRDEFMSTSSESPFNSFGDTTVNLKYFAIDPEYKVTARIERLENKEYVTLGSSSGQPVKYQKYAYAHFKIKDQSLQLLILKNTETKSDELFTAFADNTSAIEAYGAGRYLDLNFKMANRITIDFNLAYNPYCNYNHTYTCPLPPSENLLPIRIEAGEKDYLK